MVTGIAAVVFSAIMGSRSSAVEERILRGRIASMPAARELILSDDEGCLEHVAISAATLVTPAGLRLSVGMRVTIRVRQDKQQLIATTIHAHYVYNPTEPVVPKKAGRC